MAKPLSTERATNARGGDLIASALRTLEAGSGGITALSAAIHDGLGTTFIAAVDLISAARGRLIVTGMGKSGHVGRKIAATFASTGTPAFFVHPSEASHGDLGMITPDDAIMALSWSGETAELKDLIDYSRRFRIGLIAVTAVTDSTLGRAADVVLAMPQAREACPHNLAPTTSTLMQAALGDALAIALLESRGFTAIDFGHFHPGEASHGDLGMITPRQDVIMALSWSGETAELKDLIDYSRRFGIGLIAITANIESTLARAADVVLTLPQAREACPHNLAPTTSSLMQLALGDALAIALLESRGFTAIDFGKLHPAGRLGAMLKFVRNVMHGDPPLATLGSKMSEALVEMTRKGFGCIGIIDANRRLVGIITDGDLRRHMRSNLPEARVEDVMTKAPKTVRPDQLASEALEILNSSKITALIVAAGGKPVGIVHVHDLLRAGVA